MSAGALARRRGVRTFISPGEYGAREARSGSLSGYAADVRLRDFLARWGWSFALVASVLAPSSARAELDTFRTGDGHSGAKTVTALRTVVNSYAPLAASAGAGDTQLTIGSIVGDPAGFAANDLVAIWTATGNNPAATGLYELARVKTAVGSTLTLTKPITVYPPDLTTFVAGITQVVRVPEFTTVNVPSGTSIAAVPWTGDPVSGFSGGILFFLASGAVTVNGALDADKAGFRGGALDDAAETNTSCPSGDGLPVNGYAPKGEGTRSAVPGTPIGGRLYSTNGGGGGNCVQNGGGGGAHYGGGGFGGYAILGQGLGGLGGQPVPYSLVTSDDQTGQFIKPRIMFGGGGGAGEQKHGVGSAGGEGGGAMIIRAGSLTGAGTISADGESAASAGLDALNHSDGAGGGGAGGAIFIRLAGPLSCGALSASGGNGGNTSAGTSSAWGPGGGGGGGHLFLQGTFGSCPGRLNPGTGGSVGPDSHGAEQGQGGFGDGGGDGAWCVAFTKDAACSGRTPACSLSGYCVGCMASFGHPTGKPPVPNPCPTADAPFCQLNGSCTCEPHATTPCGASCATDADCAADQWCAGHCIAKLPNGQPVPDIPPLRGACTPENGARACLSGTCDVADSSCGWKTNETCCADAQCRSDFCDPDDHRCGRPTAHPCTTDANCRSSHCTSGACTGCGSDADCGVGHVCDVPNDACIAGCRQRNGVSNCAKGLSCDAHNGTVGACVSAPGPSVIDPCPAPPPPDAGAPSSPDAGLLPSPEGGAAPTDASDVGQITGGGCACGAGPGSSREPFAMAGLAGVVGALLLRRSRKRSVT